MEKITYYRSLYKGKDKNGKSIYNFVLTHGYYMAVSDGKNTIEIGIHNQPGKWIATELTSGLLTFAGESRKAVIDRHTPANVAKIHEMLLHDSVIKIINLLNEHKKIGGIKN